LKAPYSNSFGLAALTKPGKRKKTAGSSTFVHPWLPDGLLLWFARSVVLVKVEGSTLLILLLGLLYSVTITSAGFCLSLWAANSQQVTRYLLLLSVPFFMISGYCWPPTHIPELINNAARLLPLTWMAEASRLVTVKNLGAHYIVHNILALTVMADFQQTQKTPRPGGIRG